MEGTSIKNIKSSMSYYQDRVNELDNKPYYVEFSHGFKELTVSSSLDIESEMTVADAELYKDKKNKRKDVAKTD